MPDVFLSHSSKDKAFALRLFEELQREEIAVWLDEVELRVGDSLQAIEPAIRESRYLLVVVSNAAMESDWVQKEIELGQTIGGVRLLPVLIEDISQRWAGGLAELAFADFRVPTDYRRSLSRLLKAITEHSSPFLSAKAAALKVKTETNVQGELFGLSQQGVAMVYSLANRRDWLFADARDGVSRLWIVELYDRSSHAVHPFAVMRGEIHDLPVVYPLDSDPVPVDDSMIVMSCSLNEMPGMSTEEVQAIHERQPAQWKHVTKRYMRFRPVVITRSFVDSDVAVARALESPGAKRQLAGGSEIFTLTKLECDKHHGNAVLWKVSFFDASLSESVLTVGVDAVTGVVKYPAMRAEVLNADFMRVRMEEKTFVINILNQVHAIDRHGWDIAMPGDPAPSRPTAADALRLATAALGDDADRWQFAFISNTGVMETIVSPNITGADRLMRVDGTAGQWVVEVCSTASTPITEGTRSGHEYQFQQVLVTREEGARIVEPTHTYVFTVPLSQCPIPSRFLPAYESALDLALRTVSVEFEALSVRHSRRPDGLLWYFRFYDTDNIVDTIWISGDGSRVVG